MTNKHEIQHILLQWYIENKRDLPWRQTKNPYLIWLSEIILQQTRVVQGLDYYLKISQRFPGIEDLANAPEDELLKLWQGLGYYSRARNMHACAKQICENFSSVFPSDYQQIKGLKGIGPYTAAAIASIAFDLPFAVVDGNVNRVLSRLFAVELDLSTGNGKREIEQFASELLDRKNPGEFNQALMEFGALHCIPQSPNCSCCVLKKYCKAQILNKVNVLPMKKKTLEKRIRYFIYTVPVFEQDGVLFTLLKRREGKDVWKNLFEFPLEEGDLNGSYRFHSSLKDNFKDLKFQLSQHYTHILSHQKIEADFNLFYCELNKDLAISEDYNLVEINKISELAVSRLVEKFLNDSKF